MSDNDLFITSKHCHFVIRHFKYSSSWFGWILIRGLHGLKTEARTRPVPEIVWPNPTRPERHG